MILETLPLLRGAVEESRHRLLRWLVMEVGSIPPTSDAHRAPRLL